MSDHSIKAVKSCDFVRMTLAVSPCTDNNYPHPHLSQLGHPAASSPLQTKRHLPQASLSFDASISLRSVLNSDDEAWQK